MLTGFRKVTCANCGHTFMAPIIEDNGTVAEMPVTCPRCGNVVETNWLVKLLRTLSGLFSGKE